MRRIMGTVAVVVLAAAVGFTGGAASALAGPNVVVNGGFETATFSGWTTTGASAAVVAAPHTGSSSARLGSASPTNGNSTMAQTLSVPAAATLTFWYQPHCLDSLARDQEQVQLRTTSGAQLLSVLNVCSNSGAWTQVTRSLAAYRGLTVQLWFNNHDDNQAGTATYTLFDDISLTGTLPANDFSIHANPATVSVARGASATTTISTVVTNGAAQSVSFSARGLPSGVSASFTPTAVTAGASATLKLSASGSAAVGSQTITVTGTGTSASHSTAVSVTVSSVATDDFSISASPSSVSMAPGGTAATTVSTAVTGGAAQAVSLSASGLPAGATATFAPTSVTAGGSSTVTLATSTSTPAGTSTVTITGTGASASHATAVTLTVTGPPPPGLTQLSRDGYTNATSQHATEVEPDTLSVGPMLVSAFQVGRFTNGGSDDIGWATTHRQRADVEPRAPPRPHRGRGGTLGPGQ